jgi:hypothetical protein
VSEQRLASISIRPAVQADTAALGSYGASLMSLHNRWDPARFLPAGPTTPEKYASWLAGQIGRDDVLILVAEDRDSVVGYVYAAFEGADYMARCEAPRLSFTTSSSIRRGAEKVSVDACWNTPSRRLQTKAPHRSFCRLRTRTQTLKPYSNRWAFDPP